MLKNIALIASVISGLTAVTTSLRALGRSRENLRDESVSRVKTGCRMSDCKTTHSSARQSSLLIHVIVTVIWFILSIIFALPLLSQRWGNGIDIRYFLWLSPFVLLGTVLCLIWRKVIQPGK